MKLKLYFLLCTLFHLSSYSQTLDQSYAPASTGGGIFSVSSTQNVGQSFTAGLNGNLSQVNLRLINSTAAPSTTFVPGDFQLRIFEGSGYGGTVLNTTVINITSVPTSYIEQVITLSNAIPITSGNQYTIDFRGIDGTVGIQGANPGYSGDFFFANGNTALANSYDLWFKTFVATPTPATHLNFDGINDSVDLGNSLTTYFTGRTEVTLEAWVRSETTSELGVIVGNYSNPTSNGTMQMLLRRDAGAYAFWVDNGSGFTNVQTAPGSVLLNTWQHVAGTWDGTTMRIYLDGALVASTTHSGAFPASPNEFAIGYNAFSGANEKFDGDIDDLRIWDVTRAIEQINGSKDCELQGNESGLLAYYNFNQGISQADNSGVTTLIDNTSNGYDGNLTNFTLNGASSNWLSGSVVTTGSIVPSIPSVTSPVTYNEGDTATPLTATVGANGTGLLWYTSATGGTGSSTAPTPSTATSGSTSYWVSSVNANGCESDRVEMVVNVNANATHLNFDGTDDRVNIGNTLATTFNGGNFFTVEAYINIPNTTGLKTIFNNHDGGPNTQLNLRVNNNTLEGFMGFGTYVANSGSNTLSVNTWYHVAMVYNDSTLKLYIDGVEVASTNIPLSYSLINSSQTYAIGASGYSTEVFLGDIDELRVWNRALPVAEIQNNMNCELPNVSTQNGLLRYYQFNQGFDSANNMSVTTLPDISNSANNGTLSNFSLNSATSNWKSGSVVMTGNQCTTLSVNDYTAIEENFKLYPNPTADILKISNAKRSMYNVDIIDINGRVLMSKSFNETHSEMNLGNLVTGVYIVKIRTNSSEIVKRVIKK